MDNREFILAVNALRAIYVRTMISEAKAVCLCRKPLLALWPMHAGSTSQVPFMDYPLNGRDRDEWIVSRRPLRTGSVQAFRPHGFLLEDEPGEHGERIAFATVFLTNRECPWRCLMCDLWKTTLTESVPVGAIPVQIDYALEQLSKNAGSPPRALKLYNGGSFFDPAAIPPTDYEPIAERVCHFDRVIVECHPALVRENCLKFQQLLKRARERSPGGPSVGPHLEVAMGLETAHPEVLDRLNKRMTLDQFARAARFLREHQIALRTFVLVKPPFLNEEEALVWAGRSVEFAFEHGATVVSLIPTRAGNGAMDELQRLGHFTPPKLRTLERALTNGLSLGRGRIFADLWDLEQFSSCESCFPSRRDRLRQMNERQSVLPEVSCGSCGSVAAQGAVAE